MKTLGQIFFHNRDVLPKLINKAQQLSKLDKLFSTFLEVGLKRHCHLADVSATEAMVVVDGPSWATRLRYAIPDILKNVKTQPEFKDLKKIRYCVSIEQNLPIPKKPKVKLSLKNEKMWQATLHQLRENKKTKNSSL